MCRKKPAARRRNSLALLLLLAAGPALAAPTHCEAELAPGRFLISATFDDAGWSAAAILQQWLDLAVSMKASAPSARCSGGSAEALMDAVYGSEFVKTGWTPK
jgi:hypothetical protein